MAKSHKIEYDVGSNPEGTSSQQVSDVYYDDSGTPVPQIQTTDLGKVLTAGTNDPVWAEGEGGGTWGSITGDLEDQEDLYGELTALGADINAVKDAYVTKATAQTLTGAKTWTDSNNSTIINAVRMDNVLTSGSNKYEARTQPNGYRSAYIDSSQNWTGFRLMSPENPGSNPRSTLYHYVTRNGTQQTYAIQLPEASGVLCVDQAPSARQWTEIAHWTDPASCVITDPVLTGKEELMIYGIMQGSGSISVSDAYEVTDGETNGSQALFTSFGSATANRFVNCYAKLFSGYGLVGMECTYGTYTASALGFNTAGKIGVVLITPENVKRIFLTAAPTSIDLHILVR